MSTTDNPTLLELPDRIFAFRRPDGGNSWHYERLEASDVEYVRALVVAPQEDAHNERLKQIRERQKRRSYALFQAGRSPMSDDDYADTEYLLSALRSVPLGDAKFIPPAEDALHIAICQAVQEHHAPTANAILRMALNDYKPTHLTRTELIRVQQRSGSVEVTAVMVSRAATSTTPVDGGQVLITENPFEQIVERALLRSGFSYRTDHGGDSPAHLDFYLPGADLHIEVKTMHSDRIAEQMSRAANVIVAQGRGAIEWLAARIATLPTAVTSDAITTVEALRDEWQRRADAAPIGTYDAERFPLLHYCKAADEILSALRTSGAPAAPASPSPGEPRDRTRCASCEHSFCKDCYEVNECCKCCTDIPPRTVAERLAQHEHIDIVEGVLGGVTPLVSRRRIGVHHILSYLYNGENVEYIAKEHQLTPEAIKDAIAFAQEVYDDAIAAALRTSVEGESE